MPRARPVLISPTRRLRAPALVSRNQIRNLRRRINRMQINNNQIAQSRTLNRSSRIRQSMRNPFPLYNVARRNSNIPNTSLALRSGAGTQYTRDANSNEIDQRQERWFDLSADGTKREFIFRPGVSSCARLDISASTNELCQMRYCRIIYKPSVGTDHSGNLLLGIDYNPGTKEQETDINILQPNSTGTVYTEHCLQVVVNRAMKGKSWTTTAPFCKEGEYSDLFSLWIQTPKILDSTGQPIQIGQIFVDYKFAFTTPAVQPKPVISSTYVVQSQGHLLNGSTVDSPTSATLISDPESDSVRAAAFTDWLRNLKPIGKAALKVGANAILNHFQITPSVPVNQVFTMGHYNAANSIAKLNNIPFEAKARITFYDESTLQPLPAGTIVPLDTMPTIVSEEGALTGVFASVFKVAKPILTNVLAEVVSNFANITEYYEEDGFEIVNANDNHPIAAFAFPGTSARIAVNNQNDKSFIQLIPHSFHVNLNKNGGSMSSTSFRNQNTFTFDSGLQENNIQIQFTRNVTALYPVAGDVIYYQHSLSDLSGGSVTPSPITQDMLGTNFKLITYDQNTLTAVIQCEENVVDGPILLDAHYVPPSLPDGSYRYSGVLFCNPTNTATGEFLFREDNEEDFSFPLHFH